MVIDKSLLGQILVLIGLFAASFGAVAGFVGGAKRLYAAEIWVRRAGTVFSVAMITANLVMLWALLAHDFHVSYVGQVGSVKAPTWVTIVSLWSSLEGSILFWGAILGVYLLAFQYAIKGQFIEYTQFTLGTILVVCAFFALLIAGPANPFGHTPLEEVKHLIQIGGRGANPLLQNHLLMVVHPPMLYLGYAGMTIPFGIAVAALLRGSLRPGWLKPLRYWTMIPWGFLSVGIIMGGWWAYEVLGWGGYWAWDPVENASFLPWLAATGYLHATVVQERKGILKAWTLSLVLGAFLLTILGTFMTRSGVFNSVHSFTQSDIGPAFLVFLGIAILFSMGLLSGRAHLLEAEGRVSSMLSRESMFIINNAVFVTFTFTVLLGTVFPLLVEAIKGTKISVGEPYFNAMTIPIGLLLVFLMGVGPALPWGEAKLNVVAKRLALPVGIGIVTCIITALLGWDQPLALATFGLCAFASTVTISEIFSPVFTRAKRKSESLAKALVPAIRANRRRTGGYVVHLAVLAIIAAIAGSSTYRYSVEASVTPGQSFVIGPYKLTYEETKADQQDHRFSVYARIKVEEGTEVVGEMRPTLNFYPTQREPVGTPHVKTLGNTDLYMSLLSFEKNDSGRVGLKAYVIPMVPWLWWAIPVIAFGSLISLIPSRRRRHLKQAAPEAT